MKPPPLPTFSLLSQNSNTLRGPFCSNCLNDDQKGIKQMYDEQDLMIYLHKRNGKNPIFTLDQLEAMNGVVNPFTMQQRYEDLAYLPCYGANCTSNRQFIDPDGARSEKKPPSPNKLQKFLASCQIPNGSDLDAIDPSVEFKHLTLETSSPDDDFKPGDPVPPFCSRSCNAENSLALTDKILIELEDFVDCDNKLNRIASVIQSRYPSFAKSVSSGLINTCVSCDVKFTGLVQFMRHILSSSHLNKVTVCGKGFEISDLATMRNIADEAKICTSAAHGEKSRPTSFGTIFKKKMYNDDLREKSVTDNSSKNIPATTRAPKESRVQVKKEEERDTERVPLFSGASNLVDGLVGQELKKYIDKARDELAKYFNTSDLKRARRACEGSGWKEERCPFCPRDLKFRNDFPGHVLSDQHIEAMVSRNVNPLLSDVRTLTELLSEVRFSAEEKRRPSLPFFYGSPDKTKTIDEKRLIQFLEEYRLKVYYIDPQAVYDILENEYKRPSSCPFCDVSLDATTRVSHCLSQQHISKISEVNRYFTGWDIAQLKELVVKMERSFESQKRWQNAILRQSTAEFRQQPASRSKQPSNRQGVRF